MLFNPVSARIHSKCLLIAKEPFLPVAVFGAYKPSYVVLSQQNKDKSLIYKEPSPFKMKKSHSLSGFCILTVKNFRRREIIFNFRLIMFNISLLIDMYLMEEWLYLSCICQTFFIKHTFSVVFFFVKYWFKRLHMSGRENRLSG